MKTDQDLAAIRAASLRAMQFGPAMLDALQQFAAVFPDPIIRNGARLRHEQVATLNAFILEAGRIIPLAAGVTGSAVFGGWRHCYRYRLSRWWARGPLALFVMMNPSAADPMRDDRTVAKVTRFARRWGYGSLHVGNAFAYRATDQARLAEIEDPIGPENDHHLIAMAGDAALIVMAYGTPTTPALRSRGPQVARMLHAQGHALHVLRLSVAGVPWHPLYLHDGTTPAPWTPTDG